MKYLKNLKKFKESKFVSEKEADQILDKINKSTSVLRQAPVEDPKPPKEDGSEYALDFDED